MNMMLDFDEDARRFRYRRICVYVSPQTAQISCARPVSAIDAMLDYGAQRGHVARVASAQADED